MAGDRVVADADDPDAALREPERGVRADVAETLHDRGRMRAGDAEPIHRAEGEEGDAMPGRLAPSERAARADRFAGDDLGNGDALIHGIGVHEPGHRLLVGAHVGRHHVDAGPDERDHLLHVAARKVLELAERQRARIDRDAALAAAIGQIRERAFPAHPDRQRGDLADVDVERKPRAALGRAQGQMVLHAIALKHRGAAVVHMDRAGDRDGALRHQQPVALVHRDVEVVGDDVELLARHFEHGAGEQGHGGPPFRAGWDFGRGVRCPNMPLDSWQAMIWEGRNGRRVCGLSAAG